MGENKVIFLNGSSSSGKTTLAVMLQQLLPEPWQHMALDQFRDGMPGRYRGLNSPANSPGDQGLNVVPVEKYGELVTEVRFGDYGERVLAGMRRSMRAFVDAGHNIIVDDLLFKRQYLDDYVHAFQGIDVWFIGVRCSQEVVNTREALRTGRFPGTAKSHFRQVHAHGEAYDLELDTSDATPRECAERIVNALRKPPGAFAQIARTLACAGD